MKDLRDLKDLQREGEREQERGRARTGEREREQSRVPTNRTVRERGGESNHVWQPTREFVLVLGQEPRVLLVFHLQRYYDTESVCKVILHSKFQYKSFNWSPIMKDKLTDVCGIWLLRNNFIKTKILYKQRSVILRPRTRTPRPPRFLPAERDRVLYWQPTGPNPLNRRDDFSSPVLRHLRLNSVLQVALYLPSYTCKERERAQSCVTTNRSQTNMAHVSQLLPVASNKKSSRRFKLFHICSEAATTTPDMYTFSAGDPDLIAASIYDRYSVGPSIQPIYTKLFLRWQEWPWYAVNFIKPEHSLYMLVWMRFFFQNLARKITTDLDVARSIQAFVQ